MSLSPDTLATWLIRTEHLQLPSRQRTWSDGISITSHIHHTTMSRHEGDKEMPIKIQRPERVPRLPVGSEATLSSSRLYRMVGKGGLEHRV